MLTWKRFVGVVYVGIALLAAGLATAEANGLVQWYSAVYNLGLHVSDIGFHLDGKPLGYPYLIVSASIYNPAGYNGLRVSQLGYNIFVDSLNESFAVQSSSAVVQRVLVKQDTIPPRGSLNITTALGLI